MGMGIGAAMTGLRPIVEGMNMGFLLLAFNQVRQSRTAPENTRIASHNQLLFPAYPVSKHFMSCRTPKLCPKPARAANPDMVPSGMLCCVVLQISNNCGMLHYTSGGQFKVPVVVRGPGGVGRQLGAEHSQRLESYFQSIPGVQLVACSTVANSKALLKSVSPTGRAGGESAGFGWTCTVQVACSTVSKPVSQRNCAGVLLLRQYIWVFPRGTGLCVGST